MRALLLFLLSINFTFAQNSILSGKVTDSKTGFPIQGVVLVLPSGEITYSNSAGEYEFRNLKSGILLIRLSHLGFKTLTKEISIDGNTKYDFLMYPSPIKLDDVIVNVERTDKFLKDSPYSISLTSREHFESRNFSSLADALNDQPGISAVKDGVWGTDINIRGLSRNNVVTTIDGTRIETANDLSARLSMIDLNDIERIEVIKSAASSVYGSGATGGIVNIVSRVPSFSSGYSFAGSFQSGYNSVNSLRSISGSLFNSGSFWSSKISGSYRKADDAKTPAGTLKNSRFTDYSLTGSLNIQPVGNHLLKLNYQLFKAEDVGIPGGAPLFPENADVRYPLEKRELISAAYEVQNLSRVLSRVFVRYSHQFILRDVENIPNIVQNIPASGTMPPRRVSVLKITPSADHNSDNLLLQTNLILSENNLLMLGIDYWSRSYSGERFRFQKIEILDSTASTVVNTINRTIAEKPLPDSKFESIGFFAQDDIEVLKDKLRFSLGARIDRINITGEETFNPLYEINNGVINNNPANQTIIWKKTDSDDISYSANIGLKYSINPELDITLSLGYSFRSPSLEERFQFIDLGSLVRLGDPDLKPEKGYSTDFGLRYYGDDIKVVSSLFYNHITDIIVEKPGTFEGRNAQIKTNIGEARLYGFDFLINYNLYSDWLAYFTASFVKGDDISEDSNLPQIPPLNGTLGLKLSIVKDLSADFSSAIFAPQNDVSTGEISTPGYAVFNASLNFKNIYFSSVRMQFFAGVENIFDKAYRNHLSTTRGGIKWEPGRNFYIRLVTGW
ncbi:MAG: TonB-dependent receptor [Ignavibacterium sp.]|nr:TonB-dependent receptor [Ignavibacterium sp.]